MYIVLYCIYFGIIVGDMHLYVLTVTDIVNWKDI